jgi:outer membrane protein OmpA-like peptidoglycan-associated protein/opacity protein-like surface antigen
MMLKEIAFRGRIVFIFVMYLFTNSSYSQFDDYSIKIGVQFHGLLPDTEFEGEKKISDADFKFSYLGRLFLRFELIKQFIETEIGAGYGSLTGVDFTNSEYKTEIIPIDLRLILSPFYFEAINPYGYAGFGAIHYKVKTFPISISPNPDVKDSEWSTFVPVGAGFEISISDNLNLDFNGGYNFTFTDNLNYYNNQDVSAENKTYYDGYFNAALGITYVSGAGNTDKDLDGLTKKLEKELGTDPENPDSDGDGLNDGEEVNVYKINPLNADTDGDGIKDGEEVKNYSTNPNLPDSDADGLNDGIEVITHKTNPIKADSDDDGLKENDEISKYKTNPLKSDTDGEGLSDGEEISKYKTDPLKIDTDSDGLYDGEEVLKHKTDPLKKDTDDGTVDDLTELTRGTNPLDPNDDVVKIGVPIVLEGVTFETGKTDITPESGQILRSALKTLTTYPEIQVEISGHSDNVGNKKSNTRLSQQRAESVRDWLIERGINPARIVAKGYGPDSPIVPNDTPENKRKNRRIEFKRIK